MSLYTIKDITLPILHKPPHFEVKYSPTLINYYLDSFNKTLAVSYLIKNCHNYNNININLFSKYSVSNQQIINMIQNDLINAMDDAILCAFYNPPYISDIIDSSSNTDFDENFNNYIQDGIFDNKAKMKLEHCLKQKIYQLVIKRTSNTCTPYGFI